MLATRRSGNSCSTASFHRLKSPVETNQAAWMFVSDDKRDVRHDFPGSRICAALFDEDKIIRVLIPNLNMKNLRQARSFSGNELMEFGFYDLVVHQDYTSKMYRFKGI